MTFAPGWGEITVGRILLRETFSIQETGGKDKKLSIEGQESNPPMTRGEILQVHENLLALQQGKVYAVTFSDKSERDGYYYLETVTSTLEEYRDDTVTATWQVQLTRAGSSGEYDLQSRLTGTVRVNDFSLTGEKTHAPAIDHYAYYTGTTNATTMTRLGADGDITVYRSIPANTSPRWGSAASDYLNGAVLVNDMQYSPGGSVVEGVDHHFDPDEWSLSNGLVNVTPGASAGVLNVQSHDGSTWLDKLWKVQANSVAPSWDSMALLRNDPEQVVLRLTSSHTAPGRVTLDLGLRRGSRVLECYLQHESSTTLSVELVTGETNSSSTATAGYLVKTTNDANGDKFTCGSAHTFTATTSGGMSKASVTAFDFYLGLVVAGSSAVSGDAATDLRNQYIGAMAESTYVVRR